MTPKSAAIEEVERALKQCFARVSVSADPHALVAVAYSGGLDSSVLLHAASTIAGQFGIRLLAFHVHHGLSPNADEWLEYCRANAARLGVGFDSRHVQLNTVSDTGIEEAARLERYAALGTLCRTYQVPVLLTAHHQDDQAETVLMQLLRGSGVAGMRGMEGQNLAPELLGDSETLLARPLLGLSRDVLEIYAAQFGLTHVDDESNRDMRYTRNALRHAVMPVLKAHFPGFQGRIARAAQHLRAAQDLLDALAAQDFERCAVGEELDLQKLNALDNARIDNLLRFWLHWHGMRMPSTSWLRELRAQILHAKEDAQLCVVHADCEVRRFRDRIVITMRNDRLPEPMPQRFNWNGEGQIEFAAFGGTLQFRPADYGFDAGWLKDRQLEIRMRQGGDRLKPAANRSTRSLKHHYQSLAIPPWKRNQLPIITADNELIYAAGIGIDSCHARHHAGHCVILHWESGNAEHR